MDIISEWLGFDINEVAEITEKQLEQAKSIVKLIETDEWKIYESYFNLLRDKVIKPVEFYAEHPNYAHYDSGYKKAIADIEQFIKSQKDIIDKYEQKRDKRKA